MPKLTVGKERISIETEFGYTYTLIKTKTGIELEESFNKENVTADIPDVGVDVINPDDEIDGFDFFDEKE